MSDPLIEALNRNTESLGFKKSVVRGFAQAIGATLWVAVLSGPTLGILKAVGIL